MSTRETPSKTVDSYKNHKKLFTKSAMAKLYCSKLQSIVLLANSNVSKFLNKNIENNISNMIAQIFKKKIDPTWTTSPTTKAKLGLTT